jgi:MEMO1 family protein
VESETRRVRRPAVAGMFYPADPVELTRSIAEMYAAAEKRPLSGPPLAIIAPHAGYPYSGMTAARAYKLIEGEEFDTVVVVSPSHTVFFKGCSVYDGDAYQTPLGEIEIDRDLADRIARVHPSVYFSSQGHSVGAQRGEHSLEVQLPFLQIVLGRFKLVAIVMGEQDEDTTTALGEVLTSAVRQSRTLMVASSDLSHFHDLGTANQLDNRVRKAVEAFDPGRLLSVLETGDGEACGGGPIAAVLTAARRLGGTEVKVIDYTTSAETTGDADEVVGYLSAVVIGGEKARQVRSAIGSRQAEPKKGFTLDDQQQETLHRIAREAIAAGLASRSYEPAKDEGLRNERGAFVTLEIDGQLRGCIGQLRGRGPLTETVAQMAHAAAFDDPRFSPLTIQEFERLKIEISVLSPLKRVHDINEIEVGRDGLMIKLEFHSGLLLPQVATEHGWDRVTFLEQTCLKAGLPRSSYRDKLAEIYRFEALVF